MQMGRVTYLLLGGLSVVQLVLGFSIPLSPFTILFIGSGLGGLFALWQNYSEFTKQRIKKLELLLKESRETTEFWRLECLKFEKEYE